MDAAATSAPEAGGAAPRRGGNTLQNPANPCAYRVINGAAIGYPRSDVIHSALPQVRIRNRMRDPILRELIKITL